MSMSSRGHVLDAGSDLSDIGDSDSPPPTPGSAETPRTTPTPKQVSKLRDSSLSPVPTISSNKKVGRSSDTRKQKISKKDVKGSNSLDGTSTDSKYTKRGKNAIKKKSPKDVVQEPSSPSDRKQTHHEVNQDLLEGSSSSNLAGTSKITKKPSSTKKTSMKGWTYVLEPENLAEEPLAVEGKRNRKTTSPYNISRKSSNDSRFKSISEKQPLDDDASTTPAVLPAFKEGKSRRKINVHIKRKQHPQTTPDELDKAEEQQEQKAGEFLSPSLMDVNEDEEDIQPSKKRKRKIHLATDGKSGDNDDDEDECDENITQPIKVKKTRPEEERKLKKKEKERGKKKKNKLQIKSRRSQDEISADDDDFDEYNEAELNEDEAMSEDEDVKAPAASKATTSGKGGVDSMFRIKRKSESHSSKNEKPAPTPAPTAPRNSSGSTSAMPKTLAGVINHFKKPSGPEVKPTPPKAAIRKVPNMNLFDNIMGFGNKSKEATSNRSPATQSKPANLNTNTPNSPLVRPPLSSKKPEGRSDSPSLATPTRAPSSLSKPSPLTTNGQGRPSVSKVNKGAEGDHVTAAEMAILQKKDFFAYSNPTGLFDLMEDAEIMMQFEEETRKLLPQDELIAKTKLYRASRTEGLPKLVERIKQSSRKNTISQPNRIAT